MKKTIVPTIMSTKIKAKEGEFIEEKVARVVENKEPIEDGAPIIYTERKDGVIPAYNIRTDKWDIAMDAYDKMTRNSASATLICPNNSPRLIFSFEVCAIRLSMVACCASVSTPLILFASASFLLAWLSLSLI